MPASYKPDPDRSYAVIIGASQYDDQDYYPRLESIKASAERLSTLISEDTVWGLPKANIRLLRGRVTVSQAANAIEEAAGRGNVDGLFVYLCAHGRRWAEDHVPDRDLHFALSDSVRDRSYTHLPFRAVRRMLTNGSRAAAKVLIIDCCYASDSFLSDQNIPGSFDVRGVCTMVSTRSKVRALASWPGTTYTAFSGALIEIIEKGIAEQEEYLTPDSVFQELRKKLRDHGYPEPDMRGNGTSVFLCKNPQYKQALNKLPYPELRAKLDDPDVAADTADYAAAVQEAVRPERETGLPENGRQLVAEFGAKRPAAETVQLAGLLRSRDLGDYADRAIDRVYACRPGAEIAELVDLLHRQDGVDLDIDGILRIFAGRPGNVLPDMLAALRGSTCGDCAAIMARIDDRVLEVWPPSRLVELLAGLHQPALPTWLVSAAADGVQAVRADPILGNAAVRNEVGALIKTVLGMRARRAGTDSDEHRLRAAVNTNLIAEAAAQSREPADVAELAVALAARDAPDLEGLVLDTASARRTTVDLAAFLSVLDAGDSRDRADMVLQAVIRRRLPRDIAGLVSDLDQAGQPGLVERLLAGLAEAESDHDVIYTVLGLRAGGRGELAERVSGDMATMLPAARLAAFVLGLRGQQDRGSARHAVTSALRREVGEVAELIMNLHTSDAGLAAEVVDRALGALALEDALVLASLLHDASAGALSIWEKVIPGLPVSTFVDALPALSQRSSQDAVYSALRKAAEAHSIEQVAGLAHGIQGKVDGGVDTVLAAVARYRSVEDVHRLADLLSDASYSDLAWQLLAQSGEHIHDRPGGDAAAFIDRLLTRIDKLEKRGQHRTARQWRQKRIPEMIALVAAKRDSAQLMSLIDGLVRADKYRDDNRAAVERHTAQTYSAAELAALPLVRRTEHLRVVLEILQTALQNPQRIGPREVPAVVLALKQAGVSRTDLHKLLGYMKHLRVVEDYLAVADALSREGLKEEAEAVQYGHRHQRKRPQFLID
jgi:hypothetical protein